MSLDPCSGVGRFGLGKRSALARAEVEWDAAGVSERGTPQAGARVMTWSKREALASGRGEVETEHVLLLLGL